MPTVSSVCCKRQLIGVVSGKASGVKILPNLHADGNQKSYHTGSVGAQDKNPVSQQGTSGNYATVGQRKRNRRGGRRVQKEKQKRRSCKVELKVGTLNVGTMTGKGRELVDMMERRKVDILCVQKTKWKGSKARNIGSSYKLFYHGVSGQKNGVGIILKERFINSVLEVRTVSGEAMCMKLEIEGVHMRLKWDVTQRRRRSFGMS